MEFAQASSSPVAANAAPQHLVINPLWDVAALNAPQSFRDGVMTAIAVLEAAFVDPITVNIVIGYGEWAGVTLTNQSISEGDTGYQSYGQTPSGYTTPIGSGGGVSETYASLTAKLAASAASIDDLTSLVSLPGDSSTPDGAALNGASFILGTAQTKALGVTDANLNDIDGQIAMGTAFTGATLIAGAIHEITHAMGRIAGGYSLDLFRYTTYHTHDLTANPSPSPGSPNASAFFSIDGGATDLGDFGRTSDPGDFLNAPGQTVSGEVGASSVTPNDPFDEAVGIPPGSATDNSKYLTAVDLTVMDVLGFRRASELAASGGVSLNRSSYFVGSPLQATFSLVNHGAGTSYASTANLYLSTSATITAADIASGAAMLIGSAATPALAGGASQSFTANCTLPGYLAPGTYYVTAVADSGQALVDSNLDDNFSTAAALTVAPSAYVFISRAGEQQLEWNGDLQTYDNQGHLISQQFNWNYGGQALVGLFPLDPLPTTDTDVQIGPSGGALTYQVTLSQRDEYSKRAAARNLSIATGSSLTMLGGDQGPGSSNIVSALTVNGSIHNQGRIEIQTSAYHGGGILLRTATTLDGGGLVQFDDIKFYSNAGFFNESGHDASLTNVDNQITGSGEISNSSALVFGPDLGSTGTLAFVNQATVNANASLAFTIDAGSASVAVVNTGLFESTGTGGLYIQTPTLDNRGGRLFADDGAQVVLKSTRLVGGHLQSNGSGAIAIGDSQVVLDGTQTNGAITSDGNIVVNNGVYFVGRGGLINNGLIRVKTAAYSGAAFEFDGDYTLSGTGTVRLKASMYGDSALVNLTGQDDTLTSLGNTIAGSGTIGANGGGGSLNFVNKGSVVGDDPDAPLVITAHNVDNYGTITATGGGSVLLSGATLTGHQTGALLAQDGSHIDLASTTLSGNLMTAGTGYIHAFYGSVLDGATLAGTLKVADQAVTIRNTFTDNGLIQLSAGSYSGAGVQVSGSATWSGSGGIDSSATGLYSGCGLTNVANQDAALTNTGTLTLSGVYGSVSTNSGAFVVTNSGTINVTGAFTISLGNSAPTLINTGALKTSGGGALSIVSTSLKNQGGVVSALDNSHIDLSQNTILFGGTLASAGSGYIDTTDSTVTLSGASFGAITSTAQIKINDGTSLAIAGPFVNNGAIRIGAVNGGQLNAGAAFTGTGDIVLTNGASVLAGGVTNTGNRILGQGTISAALDLEAGVVDANVAGHSLTISSAQSVINNAVLEADGGALIVNAAVTGSGSALIKGGGALTFNASFDENVTFQGVGSLTLTTSYRGAVSGFAAGDTISCINVAQAALAGSGGGVNLTSSQVSLSGGGDSINFAGGTGDIATLLNTAGQWDSVHGLNGTTGATRLSNALAQIYGGGEAVTFWGGSGNSAQLLNTGGVWDTVNAANGATGTVYLTSALAQVTGGGETVSFWGGSGNAVQLFATGGAWDVVKAASGSTGTIYLTSALAQVYGNQAVNFWGGSGNAVQLLNSGGAWDVVKAASGSTGTVYLTSAMAQVYGGGDTINYWGGSGNAAQLFNTGNVWDIVNAASGSSGTTYLTSAMAQINGGGQTVKFWGGSGNAAHLANTGGAWDIVGAASGSTGTVYLTNALAQISGGGDNVQFLGGTGNGAHLAYTNGVWDGVSAANGASGTVYLTSAQTQLTGGGMTVDFLGGSGNAVSLVNTGADADKIVNVNGVTGTVYLTNARATVQGDGDTVNLYGGTNNYASLVGSREALTFNQAAFGLDTIAGFNATDTLSFASADQGHLTVTQAGADTRIALDANDVVTLSNYLGAVSLTYHA